MSHNKDVGGVANSKHLVGGAVDVALDFEKRRPAAASRLRQLGYEFVPEPKKNHLHIETNEKVESFFRVSSDMLVAWTFLSDKEIQEVLSRCEVQNVGNVNVGVNRLDLFGENKI